MLRSVCGANMSLRPSPLGVKALGMAKGEVVLTVVGVVGSEEEGELVVGLVLIVVWADFVGAGFTCDEVEVVSEFEVRSEE